MLAPIGRDGPAVADLLQSANLETLVCPDLATLITETAAGAGAVFLAEEGLFGKDIASLTRWIDAQPAWSDLPFIVLTTHQEQPAVVAWRQHLVGFLRNISFLERPVQRITLVSAAHAAIRARHRQYEIRALMREREHAAEELESLVVQRTRALEEANEQLRREFQERARVEEALRHTQRIEALGRLTGGVAHDFNNLLMVISGGLEMLDRQADPARRKRLMEAMVHAAQRGASLTRQLLAFSRRNESRPEALDIARLVGAMRDLLDRTLGSNLRVAFDFQEALWPVEVDPGQLELAVLNLVVNARDAMPNGGTILVRAENLASIADHELGGDYVRLSVIDTGTGMSAEVQTRVFEPYFTTKEVGKGSGLGLAQVYGFARQSRGTARIDSELGRGTTIALYLPRCGKAPSGVVHRPDRLRTDRQQRHDAGRILLVEDDSAVAALTSEMLGRLGYEVTHAASAAAALGALTAEEPVDVVLSDIMMPGGMNGVELAREIRRRRADLPVLLTSGHAGAAAHADRAEGIPLLPKPYGLDELDAALESARETAKACASGMRL